MGDAFTVVMAHAGRLGLAILERHLTAWADALDLGTAVAANQFDVTYVSVAAQVTCDGKIVHGAYGG